MIEIVVAVLVILAVAALSMLAYASTRPDVFSIQRLIKISAPPETIYPLIADLRAMNTWNPFVEPDPGIEISYSGPPIGKGAGHTWSGNKNVGEGRIDVTDAMPPRKVAMRLQMSRPMKADNVVEFTIEPLTADTGTGGGSTVTWAMSGRQPFLGKVVTLFFDCDRMVGGQFEKGLTKLKSLAER